MARYTEKRTEGTVLSVKKQWWLKVNTKAVRLGPLDGARFPHIVTVEYMACKEKIKKANGSEPLSTHLVSVSAL